MYIRGVNRSVRCRKFVMSFESSILPCSSICWGRDGKHCMLKRFEVPAQACNTRGMALISGGVITFFRLEPILQIALTSCNFHLVPSKSKSMEGLMFQMTCQTFSISRFDLLVGCAHCFISDCRLDQLIACLETFRFADPWNYLL